MVNGVWMSLNIIISIGKTPNWSLFNPTDIPEMSEPVQIIFKCSNVQIGCNKLVYMPNNVWMAPHVISIG